MPAIDRRRRLALLVGLTVSLSGRADEGDLLQVRARGGAAFHSGAEDDLGPGLTYGGPTGNELLLAGWVWPLLGRHLGLSALAARQGFSLLQGATALTQAGLWQVAVGPAGRLLLGPARVELAVSWAYDELPVFGTQGAPSFRAATRHAVMPALRAELDLGPVTLEAFLRVPIGVAVLGVAQGTSWGLATGGGARVTVLRSGPLEWGLLLEGSWTRDALDGQDLASAHSAVRVSGGIDVRWREVPPPPPPAQLEVYAARGPVPAAGLEVLVSTQGGERRLVCDELGAATLAPVAPGLVEVVAGGPEAGEARARGEAVAGEVLRLELQLPRPAPRVGAIEVSVRGAEGEPFPGAQVSAAGLSAVSDGAGLARLEGVPLGTLAVAVKAAGQLPVDDAVTVAPGQTTALEVTLRPPAGRLPATLRGLIRSAHRGEPVRAQLQVKERRLALEADASGAFSTQLPGGTYTVRISAPGFRSQVKVVSLKDGDQAILDVDLSPR